MQWSSSGLCWFLIFKFHGFAWRAVVWRMVLDNHVLDQQCFDWSRECHEPICLIKVSRILLLVGLSLVFRNVQPDDPSCDRGWWSDGVWAQPRMEAHPTRGFQQAATLLDSWHGPPNPINACHWFLYYFVGEACRCGRTCGSWIVPLNALWSHCLSLTYFQFSVLNISLAQWGGLGKTSKFQRFPKKFAKQNRSRI